MVCYRFAQMSSVLEYIHTRIHTIDFVISMWYIYFRNSHHLDCVYGFAESRNICIFAAIWNEKELAVHLKNQSTEHCAAVIISAFIYFFVGFKLVVVQEFRVAFLYRYTRNTFLSSFSLRLFFPFSLSSTELLVANEYSPKKTRKETRTVCAPWCNGALIKWNGS